MKGIKVGETIFLDEEKEEAVKNNFNEIFCNKNDYNKSTEFKPFLNPMYKAFPDCEFGIARMARGKAWSLDGIPDELFKENEINLELVKK